MIRFTRILALLLTLLMLAAVLPLAAFPASADGAIPGDLDRNGEVTEDDAIYLLMYSFFPEDYPVADPSACDYDGDGFVTEDDAIYLLMYTFFPADYPLTDDPRMEVFVLVNAERAKAGLAPLVYRTDLQDAADLRASEISTYMSHTRPDGTPCFTAFNVSYQTAGENIARGYPSAAEVMSAWMNSQDHRDNIMSADFTGIAVGYLVYKNRGCWVQLFVG